MTNKRKTHEPLLTPSEIKELHYALYKASDDDDERAHLAKQVLTFHYQLEKESL